MPNTEIHQYNNSPSIEMDDEHIGQQVLLPQNDQMVLSKIIKRKRNADGSLVGTKNSNPILDSRIYEVEYPDGSAAEYATNVITECLYSQTDDNGNYDFTLSCITDHRCNSNAIPKSEGWFNTKTGTRRRVITTKGWDICVEWSNGSSSWIPLKDIKKSNPVQLAEYAVLQGIYNEVALAWWSNHV